jgi:O-antigen/teichoic acid export membrane protein
VLSHTVLPGQRNRLTWNPRIARELLHFGKWILLTSVTGFLLSSGDRLILGAGIDAQRMGWYAIAFLLINVLNQLGGKLIGSVVYPALSAMWRERPVRLTNTYYRFRLPLDGVFLGASGFLCVAGASVVDLLYDARYAPAGEMLRILAIALIAKRYTLTENCFLAMDRPKLMALMISTRLLSLCLLVPAALYLLGMWGAIWGIALYEFVALPLTFHLKRRHGLWNLRRELLPLPAWPLGAALGWLFVNLSGVLTRA